MRSFYHNEALRFHISRIRPCTISDVQPDYIPAATEKERQDFIVDHIVDNDIASARDGFYVRGPCLVFKVRWASYDSSADTWQTYQSIRNVQALDVYARDNVGFRKLYSSSRYSDLHKKYPQRFPIIRAAYYILFSTLQIYPGRSFSSTTRTLYNFTANYRLMSAYLANTVRQSQIQFVADCDMAGASARLCKS